jgi:hypothetical protein
MRMNFSRQLLLLAILLPIIALTAANAQPPTPSTFNAIQPDVLPDQRILQNWIEGMKENLRGPFKRIRWFCNDGSILPPEPYACRTHDGGVQHGEWTDNVKLLRQHNYLIGTLLADHMPDSFYAEPDWRDHLRQIMLEQFLIGVDDGWILRRARYYRGAIQAEDENWHGRELLLGLLEQPNMLDRHYLLLREAVRLLPHGRHHAPLTEMRQLAEEIEEQHTDFTPLRIKLHTRPETDDAELVRQAGRQANGELAERYQRLAELIELVTRPSNRPLFQAYQLGLGKSVKQPVAEEKLSPSIRFSRTSQLLFEIRSRLAQQGSKQRQLNWLIASLDLEHALYVSANQLLEQKPRTSRRQRLAWIEQGLDALYGIGFISARQWDSQTQAINILLQQPLSIQSYHQQLLQLGRISRWAEQQLLVQFEAAAKHLAILDPLVNSFFQERLRSSPLLPIMRMIDSLLSDSQQLRGAGQALFGQPVTGLQPLNPGLARGRLEIVSNPAQHSFKADGIYLLPETIAELPPVAGILTRDAGNSLSHIQLLARNLGIPNLAISAQLVTELSKHAEETIILAVSPGGAVRIEADSAEWRKYFQKQAKSDYLIRPDLEKLDLQQHKILPLTKIRALDSGRLAGPKGANLGELKQIYQHLVPDALVIPFGRFRSLLETQTIDGQSLFKWMRSGYQHLAGLTDQDEKQRQTRAFLKQLRQQIETAPLDNDFLAELRRALTTHFGPDGSFGVFVRSDTNVEDLPDFTGAGLNKTVPHVVGFDKIVAAIRKVWASPFSERAYSWRQAHMRNPEHVYASVLLMKSVPAEKSGVLATTDLVSGDPTQLHVAVNEGVGGAVSGQRAEELLIDKNNGQVRLLAQASALQKRILLPTGGIRKIAAETPEQLLTDNEIDILRRMAELLPQQFPDLRAANGKQNPADIEFGFLNGDFILFQIRPLADSKRAKKDLYLQQMDAGLKKGQQSVNLASLPLETRR